MKAAIFLLVIVAGCYGFVKLPKDHLSKSKGKYSSEDVFVMRYGEMFQYKIEQNRTIDSGLKLCMIEYYYYDEIELYPKYDSDDKTVKFGGTNLSDSPCAVEIGPISSDHAEYWTLNAKFINRENNTKTRKVQREFEIIIRGNDEIRDVTYLKATRHGSVKYTFRTDSFDDIITCDLVTPNHTVYRLYPRSNLTDPNIEIPKYEDCTFQIKKMTLDYVGVWEMYVDVSPIFDDVTLVKQPLNITIEEKIPLIPSKDIIVHESQNVELALSENVENFKRCEIVSPSEKNTYSSDEPNCHLLINNVNNETTGKWIVRGIGDFILYAEINISVKELPQTKFDVHISLGAPAKLVFGPNNTIYCDATNPQGIKYKRQSSQCTINIDRVTKLHGGIWGVYVGVAESMEAFYYEYNITVKDLGEQNIGEIVTQAEIAEDNSYLKMSCKLLYPSLNTCTMLRFDEKMFILNEGIGYDRYTYYVNNEKKDENSVPYVQCGIHIKNPNKVDLQPWKCIVNYGTNNTEAGSLIVPPKNINKGITKESLSDVNSPKSIIIVKDNEYEIKCSSLYPINYCWFSPPNKTMFTLFPNKKTSNYEYSGDGFKYGECGIKIKSASVSDAGIWQCHLGTDNTKDVSADIQVDYYETYLIAQRKDYTWNKHVSVSCEMLHKTPLEYCYFIKPDKRGISVVSRTANENNLIYTTNGSNLESGYCELSIHYFSSLDLGGWKCIGKPFNKDVEYFDEFYITEKTYSGTFNAEAFMWTVLTIIFIVIILILLRMIFIYKHDVDYLKRLISLLKERRRSKPPPYSTDLTEPVEIKTDLPNY